MSNITVTSGKVSLKFNEEALHLEIMVNNKIWSFADDYCPRIETGKGEILFSEASSISHNTWKTGIGEGIRSTYKGFTLNNERLGLEFETLVWIEHATGDVFFEFIPIVDDLAEIKSIHWPGPMEFSENSDKWYSVLNVLQGLILPNNWPNEVRKIVFDGQMCSTAAYMPWWGQVKPGAGYIAICREPWDAAYEIDHPAGGPYSNVAIKWLPSLGHISYKRTLRFTFLEDCDYNDLCKVYRLYVKETGLFVSLAEKAARNNLVDKLIGSAIVHTGIKTHVTPESRYYNKEDVSKNDKLIPFKVRTEQIKKLKATGLQKVYLHLDGWGDPGYDNKHPDYLPACIEAGGWEGMRELSDTMKDFNYMFGIHDQYRDYYFDAPTFDENFAMRNVDGTIPDFARWAGGRQSYLCASQAPFYVKRNFEELFKQGIHLEGTYLDVFTCNELDECIHPWHRMTRKECFEYRKACFDYLLSRGILPSSEEVVDWSMQSLVFAHYAPYDFMLAAKDSPRKGIPVPLFNLVYHDCVILPWLMNNKDSEDDYMLYALLNGGSAYLDCEAEGKALDREIERYRVVAKLQEKVAKCEMVKHEFLDDSYKVERATYSDGTVVTVDFNNQTYDIKEL